MGQSCRDAYGFLLLRGLNGGGERAGVTLGESFLPGERRAGDFALPPSPRISSRASSRSKSSTLQRESSLHTGGQMWHRRHNGREIAAAPKILLSLSVSLRGTGQGRRWCASLDMKPGEYSQRLSDTSATVRPSLNFAASLKCKTTV